jgi:hypothetical protein
VRSARTTISVNYLDDGESDYSHGRTTNFRNLHAPRESGRKDTGGDEFDEFAKHTLGRPFTREDHKTVNRYAGPNSNYLNINRHLREGHLDPEKVPPNHFLEYYEGESRGKPEQQHKNTLDDIHHVTKFVNSGRLPQDVVLHRGLASHVKFDDLKPGDTISHPAFTSASTDEKHAQKFRGHSGGMMEIHAKRGMPAAAMPSRYEREVVLPRDAKLRYAGTREEHDHLSYGAPSYKVHTFHYGDD